MKTKRLIVITSLVLILALGITGTVYAILHGRSNTVQNDLTPDSDKNPVIEETFDVQENNIKYNVSVKNEADYSVYVRAAIVVTWKNDQGELYGTLPVEGADYSILLNTAADENGGKWFKQGDFYYWSQPVAKNGSTGVLISECAPISAHPEGASGYSLNVEILSQTVQAAGMTDDDTKKAVEDAWGVTVNEDGSLHSLSITQESVCDQLTFENTGERYPRFFEQASSTGIIMPGLNQNFVPQGIDFWDEANRFLISGYFNPNDEGYPSVLLALDSQTGEFLGEFWLKNVDGSDHSQHDGGVAVTGKDLYLSNGSKLFRISLDQIENTEPGGTLQIEEEIPVPVKASYCNYSYGAVWVGEFSIKDDPTYDISGHEFEENEAWTVGYRLKSDGSLEDLPFCVISTPDKIQGFSVSESGNVFMTMSYGRKNDSYLLVSPESFTAYFPAGTVEIEGNQVPLYYIFDYFYFSSDNLRAIPMAEGVTFVGNDAYIIFESGAYYYRDYSSKKAKYPTDTIWKYSLQ